MPTHRNHHIAHPADHTLDRLKRLFTHPMYVRLGKWSKGAYRVWWYIKVYIIQLYIDQHMRFERKGKQPIRLPKSRSVLSSNQTTLDSVWSGFTVIPIYLEYLFWCWSANCIYRCAVLCDRVWLPLFLQSVLRVSVNASISIFMSNFFFIYHDIARNRNDKTLPQLCEWLQRSRSCLSLHGDNAT